MSKRKEVRNVAVAGDRSVSWLCIASGLLLANEISLASYAFREGVVFLGFFTYGLQFNPEVLDQCQALGPLVRGWSVRQSGEYARECQDAISGFRLHRRFLPISLSREAT
jgi:hypothetical protein